MPAAASFEATGPQLLGKLDPFWRYSATLGPQLESGYSLVEIPDYLLRGDFPYSKRPFPKEVPFADHLSVVRLLGGYDDGKGKETAREATRARDLAWRGADGKIHYRMELLRPRLQPYLDCGYTSLTLVLDNVPWCFPEKPGVGTYGQSSPPRDPGEWRDFIKALCRELERIMGPQAARRLRFRVGTETNGRERFNGTMAEFLRHYDATAEAIGEVLPGARLGPFNISGVSLRAIQELHNVNALALAEHCAAHNLPLDWIAFSRYYRPGDDPDQHGQICRQVWDEFDRRFPQFKGISREIHEFGVAPFGDAAKGQFTSAEPGALGAALTAQMMFRLRQAGINRLWHWGVADPFRDRGNRLQHLFTSQAWLLLILDHAAGGEAWLLEPAAKSAVGTHYLGLASFSADRAILIVTAYNPNIAVHTPELVRFELPDGAIDLTGKTIRYVVLDRDTAVHDQIRRDFQAAGLLKEDYLSRPDRLGTVWQMGTGRAAAQFAGDRLPQYIKAWEQSLTLKPLDAGTGNLATQGGRQEIHVRLAAPEVLVVVVEAAGH
jgi:hypothetical protein